MLPNGAVVNSEHGQLFDSNEINLLQANEDHGYPCYDGNTCFIFPDTCTSTTYTFTHPIRNFTHPPSGCEFYTGSLIPELQGKLITGILWHTGLMLFTFNAELDTVTAEEYLSGGAFGFMVRNRDIAIRPDGTFYLITNDRQEARIRWVHPDLGASLAEAVVDPNALRAWPNPTSDKLFIDVPGGSNALQLFDAQGRSVPCMPQRMGDRYLIDLEALSAGAYVARTNDARTVRWMKR